MHQHQCRKMRLLHRRRLPSARAIRPRERGGTRCSMMLTRSRSRWPSGRPSPNPNPNPNPNTNPNPNPNQVGAAQGATQGQGARGGSDEEAVRASPAPEPRRCAPALVCSPRARPRWRAPVAGADDESGPRRRQVSSDAAEDAATRGAPGLRCASAEARDPSSRCHARQAPQEGLAGLDPGDRRRAARRAGRGLRRRLRPGQRQRTPEPQGDARRLPNPKP